MNDKKILEKLKKISKSEMSKDLLFHDFAHVEAVYENVEKLLKHEKGDKMVLLTAALFHDIKREEENHGAAGAKYAKELLEKVSDFPKELIDDVVYVVAYHDKKDDKRCNKIFSDADTMDAFSSLGIARSFMIYAKQDFSLKEASIDYIDFVDRLYKRLKTRTAKKLVAKDYKKCRKFAEEIFKKYAN